MDGRSASAGRLVCALIDIVTLSTIERAYSLARTGKYADLAQLQRQLNADGCRAVESLLSPRSIKNHLQAICAASSMAVSAETAQRKDP